MSLSILVVDDSRVVHAVIAKTLEMAEIPVKKIFDAMNGKEALDILRSNPIDLVFSDIHMPIMDGVEMIENMWADDQLKKIPVVVVSSEGSQTRVKELVNFGVKSYIRKPFTPEMIREVVDKVMGE
ncbi:MAG: response regulator [Candidatus Omnitrophota bacterium]